MSNRYIPPSTQMLHSGSGLHAHLPQRVRSRFVEWFPLISRLVNAPGISFVVAALMAASLALISVHWALAPFCIWLFLLALRIDGPFLERMVLPPLAVVLFMPTLGMSFGIPLLLESTDVDFSRPFFCMQIAFLVGTPLLICGYRLGRGPVYRNWWPADSRQIIRDIAKPLRAIAWFLCAFDIVRMIIGWRSGSLDRGFAGEVVLGQGVGIWTVTGIFNRFGTLWFFFLPFLWRREKTIERAVLTAILAFYFLIAFASGSRGLFIFPVIFLICGTYFFVDHIVFRPERWMPLVFISGLVFIYIVDVYRGTDSFNQSRLSDLSTRLAATRSIATFARARDDFTYTTGRAIVGVSDNVVYEMTPVDIPFAGARDIIKALPWTWVPQILAPSKPLLVDGNEIVISYTNIRQEGSASNISLSADLFRRFGWIGVPMGLFGFGLFYGMTVRTILRVIDRQSVVFGLILISFIVSGIQMPLASTVLHTWWIWSYDMVKHVLVAAGLVYLVTGGNGAGLAFFRARLFRPKNATRQ